jgi:hypothetical protein
MPDPGPTRKPSKYQDLADWLATHPGSLVRLSFAEVEAILGMRLPTSARTGTSWWLNPLHAWVQAWSTTGWIVWHVNRQRHEVTFTRTRGEA